MSISNAWQKHRAISAAYQYLKQHSNYQRRSNHQHCAPAAPHVFLPSLFSKKIVVDVDLGNGWAPT